MSRLILNMSGGFIDTIETPIDVSVHEKSGARIVAGSTKIGVVPHPDTGDDCFDVYTTESGAILIISLCNYVAWNNILVSPTDILDGFINND